MRNRILLVITLILSIVLFVVSSKYHTTFFMSEANPQNIVVKDSVSNKISKLDLEEYVIGVVAAEMPASFEPEALKAQAVASRTYAVYKIEQANEEYDVVTDVSNQSYITIEEMKKKWQNDFDKYYDKIKQAVNDTKGEILKYNDEVIKAYYFAMSNGYTEEASLVFSETRDYLQSVPSIYDNEDLNNYEVTKEFNLSDFCNKLNIKCTNVKINNIERSNTNRVNTIKVNDKEFKGTKFRSLLGLRSTDFDIEIKNNKVSITTRGYGHGVGMSQYGANGMAKNGQNYKEILTYYYKNVNLSSI